MIGSSRSWVEPIDRASCGSAGWGGFVGAVVAGLGRLRRPPASASNDPFFDRQWALEQIGAPRAWTVTRGAGAVIGIVDSGVEASHPDLAGKVALTADCWNRPACVDGLGSTDADGHGTLIAGVVAAGTDNGKGIAGVAPDARLVVAKVLGPGGGGPGGGHQPRDPLGRRPRRPGGEHQPGRPRRLHVGRRVAVAGRHRVRLEQGGGPGAGGRQLRRGSAPRTTAPSTPSWWVPPTAPGRWPRIRAPSATPSGAWWPPAARARPDPTTTSSPPPAAAATPRRRGRRWPRPRWRARWPCCWPRA